MTDVVVDRVRIRGTGARRLAAVAARALPDALEDALADLADGAIGPLDVRLDLDPADHDDATLAALWADRIRSAALAAGARVRPVAPPGVTPADATGSPLRDDPGATPDGRRAGAPHVGTTEGLVTALSTWLEAGGPADAVPLAVAALADRSVARAVAARLGTVGVRRLRRVLTGIAARTRSGTIDRQGPPGSTAGVSDRHAPVRPAPDRPGSGTAVPPAAHAAPGDRPEDEAVAAAAALRPHLELAATVDDRSPQADLTAATAVAGLVLCYPWLADLCRDAELHHPLAEPSHVRRVALAVLAAGPDADPVLLDDPLIRFLAGAPADAPAATVLAPLDTEPLTGLADAVLTRFAALLRGFQRSSPGFVRSSWLVRPGLLDVERDPARLVAATAPLDVVLHLLPFPVSLLRLPWTPPLTVRFVP